MDGEELSRRDRENAVVKIGGTAEGGKEMTQIDLRHIWVMRF